MLGRDLREIRIAIDAGQRLDAILRNLSLQGGYSIKRKLLVRGQVFWQRTHGGLRFGSPPPADLVFPGEVNTPELLYQHDRLLRDNYWRTGGGLVYSFPRVDLFANYTAFVGGTDTHAGRAVTVGFSVPFRLGGPQR